MKHLDADWLVWEQVWRRDDPYHTPLDRVYFDHRNGELRWLPGEDGVVPDAEIRQLHADLETAPVGTYKEIPPLTHGEHHDIFRGWLQTLPQKVRDLCNNASIGGFRDDLYYHFSRAESDDFWDGWHEYHDQELRTLAATWLLDRGFLVGWSQWAQSWGCWAYTEEREDR